MPRRDHVLATLTALWLLAGAAHGQLWEVDSKRFAPIDQVSAWSGTAIAVGDFDGDFRDDFVYGAPGYDSAQGNDVGAWYFVKGTADRSLPSLGGFYSSGTDSARAGWALAAGDFDLDGYAEAVIGRPMADVLYGGTTRASAGDVLVMEYAPGTGWSVVQTLSQADTANFSGPEAGDSFGYRLAVGHFNSDLYPDLAVAAPFEDWVAEADAGIVHVFFGSAAGLRTDNPQSFVAGYGGVLGTRTTQDHFGLALATGDFNGDAWDDLAIAAPDRDAGGQTDSGAVHVLYGSATGLTPTGQQLLDDSSFPGGLPQASERFGSALAAANFDEDGWQCLHVACYDELAIGVPGQTVLAQAAAGRVWVAYGGSAGLETAAATLLSQDAQGGVPEPNDRFGAALAAGFVDGAASILLQHDDLVVGTPYEDYTAGITDEGYVQLFFGSAAGLNGGLPEQGFNQKAGFASAPPQQGDRFGLVLVIADLDHDWRGDLLVGMPYRDGVNADAGAVLVLYGALFADGFESGGVGNW